MRLAVIPGDGIGIEVTEQALHVLEAVTPGVDATHYDLGAARWHRTGETLPDSVLEELRGHDAILLGAVGDPSVPYGVERVVRDAFGRAQARRKHLTLVHKNNVLVYAGDLWFRTVQRVAEEFPDVTVAYNHVDAAMIYLVTDPGRYDVIVTDNLFGDILTDLAAAIAGGIGLAASGNVNPARTTPSMFEPIHGSAPDIAGKAKADPTAAILSVAM